MNVTIREHVAVPTKAWRSIVVEVEEPPWRPSFFGTLPSSAEVRRSLDIKSRLRSTVNKIAEEVGVPRRHTRVRRYTGYVFVCQGEDREGKMESAMKLARKHVSRLRSWLLRRIHVDHDV